MLYGYLLGPSVMRGFFMYIAKQGLINAFW